MSGADRSTRTAGPLPIDDVLPEVGDALARAGQVVLQAPPGAGKTTRVPLHILNTLAPDGRIVMLEPRRVAARSAATFMAESLGETAGDTVGYRMRGAAKVSKATRIEVVTEGILTRMIQTDPELTGVACIIFDEFHERSMQADLGLALVLEIRAALRPDLQLVVMSATLDAGPVAAMLGDAPVVTSQGVSFDVETRWLDRSWRTPGQGERGLADAAVALVTDAMRETNGGVLVFLPGAGDIARVQARLDPEGNVDVVPLYGALPFKAQLQALAPPDPDRRRVVLATSIAETSLTIPDVRVVVDCGYTRRPQFDPASGMMRLSTQRIARAEADQRRGRAGRVARGWCFRMWTKGEEGAMAPFPPVEIEQNDLLSFTLDLALWGARAPEGLHLLTQPPAAGFAQAQDFLRGLGALDGDGAITPHGRALVRQPVHPRLAHMVLRGREAGMGWTAAALAAILEGRSRVQTGTDITSALRAMRAGRSDFKPQLAEAKRIGATADTATLSAGAVLSFAYPDRIARLRTGDGTRYVTSGGKGAVLAEGDSLTGNPWLVVAGLDGDTREAKIRLAAPVDLADIEAFHPVTEAVTCFWDKRTRKVVAEFQRRLGAIILDRKPADVAGDSVTAAMVDGVRDMGLAALPWSRTTRQLCARLEWVRAHGGDGEDMSDAALLADLGAWLGPYLAGVTSRAGLAEVDLKAALEARAGYDAVAALSRLAPVRFTAPTGTGVVIDYSGAQPTISVRLQEMLGVTAHPTVGPDRTPLLIELLSPAQRPIQRTADIAGFWSSSYPDVRKDMRGRYPRHHWPENPAHAAPTRRAKPRGT